MTGRNKCASEDHFDSNQELEFTLWAKGKHEQADMVRNILPSHVENVCVRQPEKLYLGYAVHCAESAVSGEPFAVLLADDFLIEYEQCVMADLSNTFEKSGKSKQSVMEEDGPQMSKYGVISMSVEVAGYVLIQKPCFG